MCEKTRFSSWTSNALPRLGADEDEPKLQLQRKQDQNAVGDPFVVGKDQQYPANQDRPGHDDRG